ncbi:hypothetical protein EV715DRAFT_285333 [Schizophyllum commune]
MRFAAITVLFAFTGLTSAAVLQNRQLETCPPGHPTWCSSKECLDKNPSCQGCAAVPKDYTDNCGDDMAWVCLDTCH